MEATSSIPPPEKVAGGRAVGDPDDPVPNGLVNMACTELCPHRRTQLHWHCQWVSHLGSFTLLSETMTVRSTQGKIRRRGSREVFS